MNILWSNLLKHRKSVHLNILKSNKFTTNCHLSTKNCLLYGYPWHPFFICENFRLLLIVNVKKDKRYQRCQKSYDYLKCSQNNTWEYKSGTHKFCDKKSNFVILYYMMQNTNLIKLFKKQIINCGKLSKSVIQQMNTLI